MYAPIIDGGYVIGALEIYADASRIEASIAGKKHAIWLATFVVFALLWALLVLLVRTASSTLRRQTDQLRKRSKDLMDAYAKLEESSLEAIESLNATVEAKDPYTAGHSRRVQRIAVAIGEELELPKDRLDPLRLGALFHDIGKLRVPDAILTKPARLTIEEYEVIKRHSEDGAHIVGKFGPPPGDHDDDPASSRALGRSRLSRRPRHRRDPARGHVVGLADAWDAMTTIRPYQPALKLEQAFAEVRNGRGTQFAPDVVDAFFAAYRRRPAEFFTTEAGEPEQRSAPRRRRYRLGKPATARPAAHRELIIGPGEVVPLLKLPDAFSRIASHTARPQSTRACRPGARRRAAALPAPSEVRASRLQPRNVASRAIRMMRTNMCSPY